MRTQAKDEMDELINQVIDDMITLDEAEAGAKEVNAKLEREIRELEKVDQGGGG
jgi:cell division septum initiation protein DivIVA